MDEMLKTLIEANNIRKEDCEPKPNEGKDRLNDLEDAVIELAEIISEVMG